jgi:hypothetical protein
MSWKTFLESALGMGGGQPYFALMADTWAVGAPCCQNGNPAAGKIGKSHGGCGLERARPRKIKFGQKYGLIPSTLRPSKMSDWLKYFHYLSDISADNVL